VIILCGVFPVLYTVSVCVFAVLHGLAHSVPAIRLVGTCLGWQHHLRERQRWC
jgi:hypothetical protein